MYDEVKILTIAHLILSVIYLSASSPVPNGGGNSIKLDQRQEGEWNVRADLENFIVLIIPTNVNTGLASLGLLDLLRKAPNNKKHLKHIAKQQKNEQNQQQTEQNQQQQTEQNQQQQTEQNEQQQQQDEPSVNNEQQQIENVAIETQHFIESKTAPYHVDISKARNNLAKLHPHVVDGDDLLIAHSPSISLLKNVAEISSGRISKAYVISIPVNDAKITKSKHHNNNHKELKEAHNWHLLGDGIEECGPGLKRDSQGICRTIPN